MKCLSVRKKNNNNNIIHLAVGLAPLVSSDRMCLTMSIGAVKLTVCIVRSSMCQVSKTIPLSKCKCLFEATSLYINKQLF